MADFLRRIAPAVLVGTAAVAVAASASGGAGTESAVNAAAATGSTETMPDSPTTGSDPGTAGTLEDWLRGFDDDEGDDDHDDEDSAGTRGGSGGTQTVPSQPNTGSSGSSGGTSSGTAGGSTTTACDAAEIVGPVVRTEWGPVQVAAKLANGKVCAIRTIQTPDGDRKSVMINARAVPVLEQQVMAAGSANIDGVSGATVTTIGYQTSLQAILDGA